MTSPKVEKISQTINPFGGINLINEAFSHCVLAKLFDIQNNDFGWSRLPTSWRRLDSSALTAFKFVPHPEQ
ncbi:MAG: hypothetical protein LBG96_01470 [Tannerella sp.]|nr:hypothetical protein [Tannerella sp.]